MAVNDLLFAGEGEAAFAVAFGLVERFIGDLKLSAIRLSAMLPECTGNTTNSSPSTWHT